MTDKSTTLGNESSIMPQRLALSYPDPMAVLGQDGHILFVNEQWLAESQQYDDPLINSVTGENYPSCLASLVANNRTVYSKLIVGLQSVLDGTVPYFETLVTDRSFSEGGDCRARIWQYSCGDTALFALVYVKLARIGAPESGGNITNFVSTSRDVSESWAREERSRRLNHMYRALSKVNSLIVRSTDQKRLFSEACNSLIEGKNICLTWIGILDEEQGTVVESASAAYDSSYEQLRQNIMSLLQGANCPITTCLRTGNSIYINNVDETGTGEPWRDTVLECGIRSLAALPIKLQGNPAGVFAMYSAEKDYFDREEKHLLDEIASDISYAWQNIENADRLSFLSYYDAVTGLANRGQFLDHLDSVLSRARISHKSVGLLLLKIGQQHDIRAAYGQGAENELLVQLARRLRDLSGDPVNLGRDNEGPFALILHDVRETAGLAIYLNETLLPKLKEPIVIDGNKIQLDFIAGIAIYPDDADEADSLYRKAEICLNRTETSGTHILFFEEEMAAQISKSVSLISQLRHALEEGRYLLHYQPIIDTGSRAIIGVEALLRLRDLEDNIVPPGEFIPILEQSGLINDVGLWVIQQVIEDSAYWTKEAGWSPRVGVNISQLQLQEVDFDTKFCAAVSEAHSETPIDIEVTESMMMSDLAGTVRKLRTIKALGSRVYVDDFGTGYSSLNYINKLPVDVLKIDRSFISEVTEKPESLSLVSTIISLARGLKLKVLAEGVETQEQLRLLELLQVDELQGYLFSRPVPREEIATLLSKAAVGPGWAGAQERDNE